MKGLRLYKKEKLCSKKAIDALFAKGDGVSAALAYPLRAVWRRVGDETPCNRFMIVVPKRRLRHAVDRVTVRRRVRESYRLNRSVLAADGRWEISFVFIGDNVADYHRIERAMTRLLTRINNSAFPDEPAQ